MTKFFCDACGKEINEEWVNKISIQSEIISQFRSGGAGKQELHFHQKCLHAMFEYLGKAAEEDGKV